VLKKEIDAEAAMAALDAFRDLDLQRHSHEPLLQRVWALHENLSAYDARVNAFLETRDGINVPASAMYALGCSDDPETRDAVNPRSAQPPATRRAAEPAG
jgi:hypothetical protein